MPVSGFPLQTAVPSRPSFVFLLAPKSFVPFCIPPRSLVQSLCFPIDSGQLEKGVGQGLGPAQFCLGFGKVFLAVRAYLKGHNSPKGRLCGRDQSGSRAGGFRGHEAGSLVSFGVSHKDPLYFPSEWLWSVTDSL